MQEKDALIDLEGQILKIKYTNNETGYSVISMNIKGHKNPVNIVGNIISPSPGETLKISGTWAKHPKFGEQFKVKTYTIKAPVTIKGIENFLGSGLIKGIGKIMAIRIVDKFGENSINIIEQQPEELSRIEGIGPKRIRMIKEAWEEQKYIKDLMIFLQANGIGTGTAVKLFKKYGQGAISVLKKNPYKLASEIYGIGFKTADDIAKKLGVNKNSSLRLEAGVIFVLNRLAEEGHVCYPFDELTQKCMNILEISSEQIIKAIKTLASRSELIIEDSIISPEETDESIRPVYLREFYLAEKNIAEHLLRIQSAESVFGKVNIKKAIKWLQGTININLAKKQEEAVKTAIQSKLMVITGGPGTGKTTVINAIIKIFKELKAKILLAAPTGRAANRMSESTSYPAKTIHRMLEYTPAYGAFQKNRDNPIDADLLIIDEASMIDITLMNFLMEAVQDKTVMILVGDINQLPSVGAGNVLKDIIYSNKITCIELNEIFRQAEGSHIILNAHRINSGLLPDVKNRDPKSDFYFIEQDDPELVLNIIIELVTKRIPDRFGLDPLKDIQVISPMHKGIVGTNNLNKKLQDAINPTEAKLVKGYRNFRINDKVMQIKNNYNKEVYNGDIGRIINIDQTDQKVIIAFDQKDVTYEYNEMDELTLAYAISVHKSQGSEYIAVILPLLSQHYILLQRNLIYTAITRGKKLVVVTGSKKAMAIGIKNNRIINRYTYLSHRIIKVSST